MTASGTARPPMRARNVWLALVAAVVAVSVFVVLLLIDDVRHSNGLTRYDWRVLHAFRRHRSPRLVDLSHVLAGLGNIETLVAVALIVGGLLWWRGLRP